MTVLEAGLPGEGASIGSAAKVALAECAPVPAPGMVVQSVKWMLNPDSPLSVRPSLRPDFVRFMIAMARHCNVTDFRRGLETHLGLAATSVDVLDEWKADGISFEEHRKGVILAYETKAGFDGLGGDTTTHSPLMDMCRKSFIVKRSTPRSRVCQSAFDGDSSTPGIAR